MSLELPSRKKYSTRTAWEEACWKVISKSSDVLQRLVTPYERHSLVMRVATEQMLATGKSYQEIGKELWVSPQTISTIKKAFRKSYRSYLQRGKTERKKRVYSSSSSKKSVHLPAARGFPSMYSEYGGPRYGKMRPS